MKVLLRFSLFYLMLALATAGGLSRLSSQESNSQQTLSLEFNARLAAPRIFSSGKDLIVDFYGVSNQTAKNNYIFKRGLIHQIAIVAVSGRLRLLLMGAAHYQYSVTESSNTEHGSSFSLSFSHNSRRSDLGPMNAIEADATIIPKVSALNFHRDDSGGGMVEIIYSGATQLEATAARSGNNLILKLNALSFDPQLLQRLDVTDFATPIKYINPAAVPEKQNGFLRSSTRSSTALVITLENRNNWDYALYQLPGKLLLNVRQHSAAAGLPLLKENKSDLVTFNFQNIEVRALLQLLAEFSGYNVIMSDNVSGSMALALNNIAWDQVLNLILTAKGLALQREGNVLRIAPSSEIAALSRQQQDSQKLQEAVEPLDTLTLRLKYAQVATIQAMIHPPSTVGGSTTSISLLSSRGTILVDTRTNTLIINDTPSRLKEVEDLVAKIDIPVKQVLIEARIVAASSTFEKDFGTRLLLAGIGGGLTYANTLENGITINQNGINAMSAAPNAFINQNFGVNAGAALSTVFTPNSNTLIGLEVDALELQSQGRTISSPKVMTANYQMATIQQGVQIPYQQASSAGNTNVAFINATLSLQVTPQITDDGYVLLNVNIQKDTPSATLVVQGTPAIDTNSVTTQIRVKDAATILVGGIYIDDQQQVVEQVPLLGDIPYLGWLFKSQATRKNKTELLIFITPRVIANSLDNDN